MLPYLLLGYSGGDTSLLNNQSLGSAASALRANPIPAPLAAGDVTASFRKLNPQVGGDIPRPSEELELELILSQMEKEAHSVCGPQTETEQLKSTEWQRSVGLEPGDPTASTRKRRPLRPPPEELPDPVSFSLEEVLRRLRRTNKSCSLRSPRRSTTLTSPRRTSGC